MRASQLSLMFASVLPDRRDAYANRLRNALQSSDQLSRLYSSFVLITSIDDDKIAYVEFRSAIHSTDSIIFRTAIQLLERMPTPPIWAATDLGTRLSSASRAEQQNILSILLKMPCEAKEAASTIKELSRCDDANCRAKANEIIAIISSADCSHK